jgi:hypothetical protein
MSSVAISGNASGAGVLTIAAPNTASSYTLTLPTQTGTLVSGTSTAGVVAPAGTTTLAPILLTSGTNLTSATAGAIEYDGKVVYGTPQAEAVSARGALRGIIPTQQYYRLNADLALASSASALNPFGVSCTLAASTVYEFEIVFALSRTAGAVSHTVSINFTGGTATLNNIAYFAQGFFNGSASVTNTYQIFGSSASGIFMGVVSTSASTAVTTANTSANEVISMLLKGTVSVNAAGTFFPQYICSAAPGGGFTTVAGSYIKINPLSASGAATNVGTWA